MRNGDALYGVSQHRGSGYAIHITVERESGTFAAQDCQTIKRHLIRIRDAPTTCLRCGRRRFSSYPIRAAAGPVATTSSSPPLSAEETTSPDVDRGVTRTSPRVEVEHRQQGPRERGRNE